MGKARGYSGMQGKKHTQVSRDKMSVKQRGRSPWNKGLKKEIDARVMKTSLSCTGRIAWNKGLTNETDDRVARISKTHEKLWEDPSYAKKVLRRRIPSYPEKLFSELCPEFRFVGDGNLIIGGKNPDFVHINDRHKLVEIWGEFFHKGQNPHDRIDFFKARGFQCLVIWAGELKDRVRVLDRVLDFTKGV
jgi:very-short-patch-repair endonuclease